MSKLTYNSQLVRTQHRQDHWKLLLLLFFLHLLSLPPPLPSFEIIVPRLDDFLTIPADVYGLLSVNKFSLDLRSLCLFFSLFFRGPRCRLDNVTCFSHALWPHYATRDAEIWYTDMTMGRERERTGREREKLVVTGFNRGGNSTNFIRVESSFWLESFRAGSINFNQKEKKKKFIRNSKIKCKIE